jgi:E-phenylitaconyl-CoA hydratase
MSENMKVDLTTELPGILYEKIGSVAVMTLNRPDVGNALSRAMRPVVQAIWEDVKEDDSVRALIITGAGDRHFCTGLDLAEANVSGGTSTGGGRVKKEIVWSPLHAEVWKPVICAVNGLVAGGGLHFVADADIVVGTENADVMDTHTNVGMVGAVENIALAHRLPIGSVLRMTFMGRSYRMPAQRAYQLGLYDEIVPTGESLSTAMEIAKAIAQNSPAAVSLSKQAIWSLGLSSLNEAQEYGWALARMHWAHPDFAEGPKAFVERRPPEWKS